MPPAFSIIVPVGSVGDDLRLQLESLLQQDVTDTFEVVLSVNTPAVAATQQLSKMLNELGDSRIRTVSSSDKRGASHARNVGARAARTETLIFCDADDAADAGWARHLLVALGKHGAVGGTMSDDRFTPVGTRPLRAPATPDGLPTFLDVPYIVSANLIMSRAAFDAVDGFDTTLTRCEDIAISWALMNKGYTIGYSDKGLMHYRPRTGLRDMMHQHYLYGIGMSEVLSRYPMPGSTGTAGAKMFKPNSQPSDEPRTQRFLRRGSIAAGRIVGMAKEKLTRPAG